MDASLTSGKVTVCSNGICSAALVRINPVETFEERNTCIQFIFIGLIQKFREVINVTAKYSIEVIIGRNTPFKLSMCKKLTVLKN